MTRYKPLKKRWIEYCRKRAAQSKKYREDKATLVKFFKDLKISDELKDIILNGSESDIILYENTHGEELSKLERILIDMNSYKLERYKDEDEEKILNLTGGVAEDIEDFDPKVLYDEGLALTEIENSLETNFGLIKAVNGSPEVSEDGKRAVQLRAIDSINKLCIKLSNTFSLENMKKANKRLLMSRTRGFSKKAQKVIAAISALAAFAIGLVAYGNHRAKETTLANIISYSGTQLEEYKGSVSAHGPFYDYLRAVKEGNPKEAAEILKSNKSEVLKGIARNVASQEAGFTGDIVEIKKPEGYEEGIMPGEGVPYAGMPYSENTIIVTIMEPDGKANVLSATKKSIINVKDGTHIGSIYEGLTSEQYEILNELLENGSITLKDAENALISLSAQRARNAQEAEESAPHQEEPDAGEEEADL